MNNVPATTATHAAALKTFGVSDRGVTFGGAGATASGVSFVPVSDVSFTHSILMTQPVKVAGNVRRKCCQQAGLAAIFRLTAEAA